jgi:hypothetical protein
VAASGKPTYPIPMTPITIVLASMRSNTPQGVLSLLSLHPSPAQADGVG